MEIGRRATLWLLSSVLLLFVGCKEKDPGTAGADRQYMIATVVKLDGIAWFDRMKEGVKRFAQDTGHRCLQLGPSQADAALQVQIIEDLIAQGVNAICVVPFSVEAVEPVLKKARDHGIVVVCHEASNQVNADAIIEAFDNAAYGAPHGPPGPLYERTGRVCGLRRQSHVQVAQRVDRRRNRQAETGLSEDGPRYRAN